MLKYFTSKFSASLFLKTSNFFSGQPDLPQRPNTLSESASIVPDSLPAYKSKVFSLLYVLDT